LTLAQFAGVEVVLLDVEGTTSPISFVYDKLFPYARHHLRTFLSLAHDDREVARALSILSAERDADPAAGASVDLATYAEQLMDRDSKSPGLKALQGLIWNVGYGSGALRGVVFDDVPEALRRWHAEGIRVAIYSSGSVLAQQLIFGTTIFGDLTAEIGAFFDTAVGAKREAASYRAIAERLGCQASAVLFVSDVMPELTAAARAGCQVSLIVRPGNPSQADVGSTPVVSDLLAISADRRPAH
jgi:enolase-phosphatase E1